MDCPSNSKRPKIEDDMNDLFSDDEFKIENDSESESDIEYDDEVQTVSQTPKTPDVRASQSSNIKNQSESIPFSDKSGLKIQMSSKEPIDYFDLVFNDDFYNLVVCQTNLYAVEVLSKSEGEKNGIEQWKDVTKEEIRIWLGVLLHTGTIRMNRLTDYWKADCLFNFPAFPQFMSKDRFVHILRALNFNNNVEDLSSLAKISALIDIFNERMEVIYDPHKQLSTDESLVLWRGYLIFHQDMKKCSYDIKFHMLGEANGLALKLIIYGETEDEELGVIDHPSKVWIKMISSESVGKITLNTTMVIKYNKNVGDIDYLDQMLTYYPCKRKQILWYKKLAIHLFQTILFNSWHLYNADNSQKMSFYDFRLSVIRKLLGPLPSLIPQQIVLAPDAKIHLPKFCEKNNGVVMKRSKCKLCWETNMKKTMTPFICPDCPTQPDLCVDPCFRLYHKY